MLELRIKVEKNICHISQPMLTSGCVNAVACLFSFDDSWDGYELIASFESAYGIYHCMIEDGKCNMPNAVVAHASSVKIGVIGKKGNITITTNTDTFFIDEGANKDGIKDPDYQPTLLEQILSITEKCKRIAESVRSDADAGKFNGKDYVLTDADKSEIADTAAETVVNDYAIRETVYIGLDGYCYEDGIAYPPSNLDLKNIFKYDFRLRIEYANDEYEDIPINVRTVFDTLGFSALWYDGSQLYSISGYYPDLTDGYDGIVFNSMQQVAGGYLIDDRGVLSVDKEALLGDVESALDEIIALQEQYIGGMA